MMSPRCNVAPVRNYVKPSSGAVLHSFLRLFLGRCCCSLLDGDLAIQWSRFCDDELNTFHLSSAKSDQREQAISKWIQADFIRVNQNHHLLDFNKCIMNEISPIKKAHASCNTSREKKNNKWLQPPRSSPAFSQGSHARRQLQDLYREMRKLRPDERGSRASDSESDEGGVMGGVEGGTGMIFWFLYVFFVWILASLEGSCFFDFCWIN